MLLHTILEIFRKISDVLGLQWAPLDLPMARRLQTLAALGWVNLALFGEIIAITLFIKLIYSSYWWIGILYAVWMLNDIEICHKGGRRIEWIRNWSWWRYYRDYFPIKLVKTADLDPSKNYLLACFPHGVVSSGVTGAFATNALDFYKVFPGMTCNVITLTGHFLVPFFRDLLLGLGACAASRESLLNLLDVRKRRGNCVALMVGGAAEALNSHPGEYKVILNKRRGFIRLAMNCGASLVPVFSFGEPDVYRPFNNPQNSLLRRLQEKVKDITGVSPIFPIGRGIFQYSFGLLPLRSPITTVVGAPINVVKNLDPTDDEVAEVHAQFTRKLIELFDSEKSKYLKDYENTQLIIT